MKNTDKNKTTPHPSMHNHPIFSGGWHIRTSDGRTYRDLSIDEAVEIHNEHQEMKTKIIKLKTNKKSE